MSLLTELGKFGATDFYKYAAPTVLENPETTAAQASRPQYLAFRRITFAGEEAVGNQEIRRLQTGLMPEPEFPLHFPLTSSWQTPLAARPMAQALDVGDLEPAWTEIGRSGG